jgi:signal transduction histidine kinase
MDRIHCFVEEKASEFPALFTNYCFVSQPCYTAFMDSFTGSPTSSRILSVTEEELSRIILDIHDRPVQYLFAALSLLAGVQRQLSTQDSPDPLLVSTVDQITSMIETSLHEIKSFLGTFRPPEFQRRSLFAIIRGLVIQHEEFTSTSVELKVDDLPDDVALPVKIALYRILQEALSNAHRHAGTDHQWVHVWSEAGHICLEVEDRGKGFEPPPLEGPQATERVEHIGLRGMRDRVALLGGTFHLVSHPGQGTRVTVKVPAHV